MNAPYSAAYVTIEFMLQILSGKLQRASLNPKYPKTTRPVTSQMLRQIFDILGEVKCNVLDLFAGTGVFGFEAISRGATHATLVEKNLECCRLIEAFALQHNIQDQLTIKYTDAKSFAFDRQYDLIFVDPPYEQNMLNKSLDNVANQIHQEGLIVTKSSKREEIRNAHLECLRKEIHGDSVVCFLKKAIPKSHTQ